MHLPPVVSRQPPAPDPATPLQKPPIFGPPANTELTVVERTLLRQANQRASERCAVAELDLKTHLAELSAITRQGHITAGSLPPNLLVGLRVAVEDFTSSARSLYPSADHLLVSLKQTVAEAVGPDDVQARDLVQTVVLWAIEAYFAR